MFLKFLLSRLNWHLFLVVSLVAVVSLFPEGAWARDGAFEDASSATGLGNSGKAPRCLTESDPEKLCLAAAVLSPTPNLNLTEEEIAIAAVGQAIENGQEEVASDFVEAQGEGFSQETQDTLGEFVEDGLPLNSEDDPRVHPDKDFETSALDGSGLSPISSLQGPSHLGHASNASMSIYFDPGTAKVHAFSEKTTGYVTWACTCGGNAAQVRLAETTNLHGWEIAHYREFRVIIGPRVDLVSTSCRIRYDRRAAPDSTVYNWSSCHNSYNSSGSSYMPSGNKRFTGTRGAEYYSNWVGDVDPLGPLGKKPFDLRGTSWKYPSGGGTPSF
ncbi:MAG: hypothetical protein QM597_04450 [Aeromicrobium sp.]|uniref:hypothetical protein n=1 Tax=Aeromicrobium sp. TaxID=1871063 RepID=UPI0039E48F37